MKRLRIVSRTRFIAFIVIVILAGMLAAAGLMGALAVWSISPVEYRQIQVQSGDTLWEIAAEAYPGEDVRPHVYDICQLNHITAGALQPGQSLRLPLE